VTDKEFKGIPIRRHAFHGDWNYTIQKSPADDTLK
jgi:hypothetical protein